MCRKAALSTVIGFLLGVLVAYLVLRDLTTPDWTKLPPLPAPGTEIKGYLYGHGPIVRAADGLEYWCEYERCWSNDPIPASLKSSYQLYDPVPCDPETQEIDDKLDFKQLPVAEQDRIQCMYWDAFEGLVGSWGAVVIDRQGNVWSGIQQGGEPVAYAWIFLMTACPLGGAFAGLFVGVIIGLIKRRAEKTSEAPLEQVKEN